MMELRSAGSRPAAASAFREGASASSLDGSSWCLVWRAFYSGSARNPLCRCVEHTLEVGVGDHALGHEVPDSGDADPGGVQLTVVVAGVLVLRRHDLTAVVRAAERAHEVRSLRLVALRALDRRDGVELPVRSAPAAGLGPGGFPFEIR